MYWAIAQVTLRSREPAELGLVDVPDPVWGQRVRRLLGHLRGDWAWQLDQTLVAPETGVEGRFHVLSRRGRPFACAMTVERDGIGILGHVYTAPSERRQGAADLLLRTLPEDFRRRGGRALSLRTGFGGSAYRTYRRHGFASSCPRTGSMACFPAGQEAFEREVFAPGPYTLEPLRLRHWPLLPALAMCRHPARTRILGMDAVSGTSPEEGALAYLAAMARGRRSHSAVVAVYSRTGVPVGIAAVGPAPHLGSLTDLVDAFAAPGHEDGLDDLLATLPVRPSRRQVAFVEPEWPVKAAVLLRAGFRPDGGDGHWLVRSSARRPPPARAAGPDARRGSRGSRSSPG